MKTLNFTDSFTQRFLDPLQNVHVFKNIISINRCKDISDYSKYLYDNNLMSKNPAGDLRYRKRFLIDSEIPKSVKEIIEEFNSILLPFNALPDEKIGNILTYNTAGSFIQAHQDDYGALQLRINIIVEKEEHSGNPIIEGLMYKIKTGDSWVFSPSHNLHGTSILKNGQRINLSMGWNFESKEDYLNAFDSLSS